MLNFDAFELMEELPAGKHAYDMVWVDELYVISVPRGSGTTFLLERQTRSSSRLRVAKTSESLSLTLVLHLCALE